MTNKIPATQVAIGAIAISFSAVFVKLSILSPTVIGFYRLLFGGIGLLLLGLIQKEDFRIPKAFIKYVFMGGFFFAMDLFFYHQSTKYVGPGIATILGNMQVMVLILVGFFFYKEHLSKRFLSAIPLVILGMLLLVANDWPHVSEHYKLGVYCGFGTAIGFGFFTVTMRQAQLHVSKTISPLVLLTYVCAAGCLILGAAGLLQHDSYVIPNAINWCWVLSYGFFGQILGWLLITKGLPKLTASFAGMLILLQPSLAFVWDIIIFHHPINIAEVAGAIITLFAIYLAGSSKPETAVSEVFDTDEEVAASLHSSK